MNSAIDLNRPLQFLKGAGPRRATKLAGLNLTTIGDLLEFYPRAYLNRSALTPLGELSSGTNVTSSGFVRSVSLRRTRGRMRNVHVILEDESGVVEIVWFNQPYLRKLLQRGTQIIVSGPVEFFSRLQFKNPEFELVEEGSDDEPGDSDQVSAPGIVPVYPLTAGISQKVMRLLIKGALEYLSGGFAEFMPTDLLTKRDLISWRQAHSEVHWPASQALQHQARRRIAYQELFDLQLLLAVSRRYHRRPQSAVALKSKGKLRRKLIEGLPFDLTGAQKRVIEQITGDLGKDYPMNRLLEGDVGCGKTLVAFCSALDAVEAGAQVALMAPTEILARQHADNFESFCQQLKVPGALLLGGRPASESNPVRERIASGDVKIAIGTHALIQEAVEFQSLGLVIVDEQHRFGVMQRARLLGKGNTPHMLIMTATPIPRTLALTMFGDLDLSVIDEKPLGRPAPKTHLMTEGRYEEMLAFIGQEMDQGAQAYFVCPLIDASERSDLKAATDLFERLLHHPALARHRGALLHGRMKSDDKAAVMSSFAAGEIRFLVTTTVIEVGVDVGNANLMVIEHPERFGLSQLHQLRGRIGRGRPGAHLFMVRRSALSPDSLTRLQVMVNESDGFRIAEADLRQRGPGDFFGVQQSGLPALKVADPVAEPKLLEAAREDAFDLVNKVDLIELAVTPLWGRLNRRFSERMKLYEVG